MKKLIALLLACLASGMGGCEPMSAGGEDVTPGKAQPTTTPAGNARPTSPRPSTTNPLAGAGPVKLVVTIRMTTIEVPVGTASGSEELWSYLDEESIRAARSVGLGRNGIRVGLGRAGSWPDLAEVLKRMTGQAPTQSILAARPNDPFQIVLKHRQPEATIFTFRDNRTLSGRDYPIGDYLLAISCTLNEDDLTGVMLATVPQVRSVARVTRYIMSPLGPQMVTQPKVYSLDNLSFRLMVAKKGFLVIGPGANARNPSTVGHHFLTRTREGVEYETLLVLMPEVVAAPTRQPSPANTRFE